jgi:hypothetical protein
MSAIASITWLLAVLAGMLMLAIWLVELDRGYQRVAATRLPVPALSAHALLGLGGLPVWIGYILTDRDALNWAAVAILGAAAMLGLFMARRWLAVRREGAVAGARAGSGQVRAAVPPERHIPPAAVVVHGVCAVTTIVLVLLTALRAS